MINYNGVRLCDEPISGNEFDRKIMVVLSDGTVIYEDEDKERPFWIRLKDYLRLKNLSVEKIKFKIGKYMNDFPSGKRYYYYKKRVEGDLHGPFMHSTRLGYSDDGKRFVCKSFDSDGTHTIELEVKDTDEGVLFNA
jgi:hypothetical protein